MPVKKTAAKAAKPVKATRPKKIAEPTPAEGCRAFDGLFSFTVRDWPPSKSNLYRHGRGGTTYKAQCVLDFERRCLDAIEDELHRWGGDLGYNVQMHQPTPKRIRKKILGGAVVDQLSYPKPYPLNPLYGPDVEFDIIVRVYEPFRTNRDSDGVLKVVLDCLTKSGVIVDDRQLGNIMLQRAQNVGLYREDRTEVCLRERVRASWKLNPNGKILSTRDAARYTAQGIRAATD